MYGFVHEPSGSEYPLKAETLVASQDKWWTRLMVGTWRNRIASYEVWPRFSKGFIGQATAIPRQAKSELSAGGRFELVELASSTRDH